MTQRLCHAFALLALIFACALPAWAQEQYEWADGQWQPAPAPQAGSAQGELAIIRRQVENQSYSKAISSAKKFIKKHPDSPLTEEAMLLAGEAQFARGHYFQAYEWYEKQLAQYPVGQYSARALERERAVAEAFLAGKKRIAMGIFRLPAQDEGIEILTRIAEHAPGTELAQQSMLRIGDWYYSQRKWVEAADAYDAFLKLFANAPASPYAMLQGARATYNVYRGEAYDETPLLDARQRFESFASFYPADARQAGVPAVLEDIRQQQARRLLHVAKFYDRTGKKQGAAHYYQRLAKEFPDTQAAREAGVGQAQPSDAALPAVPQSPAPADDTKPNTEATTQP